MGCEKRMVRYATSKQVEALTDAVNKLASQIVEVSAWQTYHVLKDIPQSIPEKTRKEIVEKSDGLIKFLYQDLFRKNPLSFSLV